MSYSDYRERSNSTWIQYEIDRKRYLFDQICKKLNITFTEKTFANYLQWSDNYNQTLQSNGRYLNRYQRMYKYLTEVHSETPSETPSEKPSEKPSETPSTSNMIPLTTYISVDDITKALYNITDKVALMNIAITACNIAKTN